MNIFVVDAQGGGIGRQLVSAIRKNLPGAVVTAVGTNSIAASAMLKAPLLIRIRHFICFQKPQNNLTKILESIFDLLLRNTYARFLCGVDYIYFS